MNSFESFQSDMNTQMNIMLSERKREYSFRAFIEFSCFCFARHKHTNSDIKLFGNSKKKSKNNVRKTFERKSSIKEKERV